MSNNNFSSNGDIEMTSKIIGRRNGYNSQSQEIMRSDSDKFPQKRIKSGRNQGGAGIMERLVIDAARNGDVDEMESILDDGANPNVMDEKGRTALHWIVCSECSCSSCLTNYETCLRLLITSPKTDINLQDANGDTALHLAADNQMQKFAEMLLAAGADVSIKNDRGEEVVSVIARKLPDTMIYLLNESITVDQYEPHNDKCVLQVDFGPVVGHSEISASHVAVGQPSRNSFSSDEGLNPRWHREMQILKGILQTNHKKKLLTHPVISIFLEQKWRRVSKFFWVSIVCYILWVILYTSYVIMIYLITCPCRYYSKNSMETTESTTKPVRNFQSSTEFNSVTEREPNEQENCHVETGFNADVMIIVILTAIMALIEIVKFIITPKMYIRSAMNLIHWVLIALVFLTTVPNFVKQTGIWPWQYQTAAFTVFLSWTLILYQIGRFPSLGRFIEMFGHVLKNFGFFMITYASLFIGFAIAFCVLFPGNTPFFHFFFAILKVFVMMAGEVDYQEMFYGGESNESVTGPLMGHLLYAIFVVIVSIVLMNLLIGLTVSDIQALQKEAEFIRVSRLILEIFHIESFIFSKRMPSIIGNVLKGFTSVIQPTKHSKHNLHFTFRPNCPEDEAVPERFKRAALQLASASYYEQRSQKCSKGQLHRGDNSRLSIASTSTSSSSSLETHSLDASTVENTRKSSTAWSR